MELVRGNNPLDAAEAHCDKGSKPHQNHSQAEGGGCRGFEAVEKGNEKRNRHDVHSEKREDFFRLGEDGIFESVEGVDSRKWRGLAD